jgi:hypothetical protein
MGWLFNYIVGQIAWTIIRFELHHIWNPDWTFAFPQGNDVFRDPNYVYDSKDFNDYQNEEDDGTNTMTGEEYSTDDPLIDEFSLKDGGPIPLLQMTYINKTTPKPCDKEVILYELNDERLYHPNKQTGKPTPVKGNLKNCHESTCER